MISYRFSRYSLGVRASPSRNSDALKTVPDRFPGCRFYPPFTLHSVEAEMLGKFYLSLPDPCLKTKRVPLPSEAEKATLRMKESFFKVDKIQPLPGTGYRCI